MPREPGQHRSSKSHPAPGFRMDILRLLLDLALVADLPPRRSRLRGLAPCERRSRRLAFVVGFWCGKRVPDPVLLLDETALNAANGRLGGSAREKHGPA